MVSGSSSHWNTKDVKKKKKSLKDWWEMMHVDNEQVQQTLSLLWKVFKV